MAALRVSFGACQRLDLNQIEDDEARSQLDRLATLVDDETYNKEACGIEVDSQGRNRQKAEREARELLESLLCLVA